MAIDEYQPDLFATEDAAGLENYLCAPMWYLRKPRDPASTSLRFEATIAVILRVVIREQRKPRWLNNDVFADQSPLP